MDFNSELEIREQLSRFVSRESTLSEFQNWFIPRSWNLFENSSSSLRKVVSAVELALAEFSNSDWTEPELRNHFAALIDNYEVEYPEVVDRVEIRTGSNASLSVLPLMYSWITFDKPILTESA